MDILKNLNSRIKLERMGVDIANEHDILNLIQSLTFVLPDDYIYLLQNSDTGYLFSFDNDINFSIWGAKTCLTEFQCDDCINEYLPNALLIGSDLGDWAIFYGSGKEGFGLYVVEDGSLGYDEAKKISNSLTDILVHGVGIDIYKNYM